MMLIPVTCYVPLLKPLPALCGEDAFADLIEQRRLFIEQLPSALEEFSSDIRECSASKGEPPANVDQYLYERSFYGNIRFCEYIVFSLKVEIDSDEIRDQSGAKLEEGLLEAFAANIAAEALENVLALSELAFPGVVNTIEGLALAAPSSARISAKGAFYTLHNPSEDEPSWPPLRSPNLLECITWAKRIGFNSRAFATTRIGRALACFSHVISLGHSSSGESLFRAMQGLEAFYCEGGGELRRQLSTKINLWLGPSQDNRNTVGRLYDSRSKFIHGASNIEYAGYQGEHVDTELKMSAENNFASCFSVRLLIATLQECINKNITDIEWTFGFTTKG